MNDVGEDWEPISDRTSYRSTVQSIEEDEQPKARLFLIGKIPQQPKVYYYSVIVFAIYRSVG